MSDKAPVTVFGASGYLGRAIVRTLLAAGHPVRGAVRNPRTGAGKFAGETVDWVQADIRERQSILPALAGSKAAVNAVSAYVEKGDVRYHDVHVTGARHFAAASHEAGLDTVILVSGIGADPASPYKYIRKRGQGEEAVRTAHPGAIILRPGVLYGGSGGLLGMLAALIRKTPVIPLAGGGRTRLQPAHRGDVAAAVAALLRNGSKHKLFELGGADIAQLRDIVIRVMDMLNERRPLVSVPFWAAATAARLAEMLPGAPLSVAQIDLLRADNIADSGQPGFASLGIRPRPLADEISLLAQPAAGGSQAGA